ncbi:P-type ATPase, translocating [Caldisphaera lagunensis DSM 15908]|uniref:Potassium-transporting ATPase ATP-binding subunit n=1 Tax=Caldisphaera lagunensis (strain DSM 15908 / JCM 11604 / ANMR 0165 / IC-154) TaxID=1056495 RepID=L0A9Q1_CALLD|nr:HAD-IC family P-type ATPase [Caldisphaera lagunensis]AFZ70613.1 P-type ATPase, translocating [Caldisphaera lagunensis DSM 15908]
MSETTRYHEKYNLKKIFIDSILKLNPVYLAKNNPVMFVVVLGFIVTLLMIVLPNQIPANQINFYIAVSLTLFFAAWFSTFSEAFSEYEAKARVDSLKIFEKEIIAHKLVNDHYVDVKSNNLKPGERILVKKGEIIPIDGFIIDGSSYIDESMITGESEPVFKNKGDHVIGGTKVIEGELKIEITAERGRSFIDKMISLVSQAKRPKSQSEISLNILLSGLSLIFLIVTATLYYILKSLGYSYVNIALIIALLVALMPTTIGGLLPAIGISGISRLTRDNIIAKSGKAIEAASDADVILLDKTGTITEGNRAAVEFIPLDNFDVNCVAVASYLASFNDNTREGRSIIDLIESMKIRIPNEIIDVALMSKPIEFNINTRYSGIEISRPNKLLDYIKKDKTCLKLVEIIEEYGNKNEEIKILKGAVDSLIKNVKNVKKEVIDKIVEDVGKKGETPLLLIINEKAMGIIVLKDRLKPGIKNVISDLKIMGITPIMVTGDNPLTAKVIATEAGIDNVISQAKPVDKLNKVHDEQNKGHVVIAMGDGTNDAPALAKADVGVAMNSGTRAAKEAANMIDLDSNPSRVVKIIELSKQLLVTRGAITTFSIANDISKYFTILPMILILGNPKIGYLNILHLTTPQTAILATMIFNAIIIPSLIPLALRGVKYKPESPRKTFIRNFLIYGIGGALLPFAAIKLIDIILAILMGVK